MSTPKAKRKRHAYSPNTNPEPTPSPPVEATCKPPDQPLTGYIICRTRSGDTTGWAVRTVLIPEHVVKQYTVATTRPDSLDLTIDRLVSQVERQGVGGC